MATENTEKIWLTTLIFLSVTCYMSRNQNGTIFTPIKIIPANMANTVTKSSASAIRNIGINLL